MSDTSAPKKASTSPITSLWQWAKSSPMEEPVTDPQESKLKKYQKRREQVRRAQRNHREKKEKYLHFLETEVASLRKEKILLTQRAEKAEAEIQRLTQDMPHLNATVTHSNVQPLVTVSISHGTGSEKGLHVDVAGSLISAAKNTSHPISCKCSPTDESCAEISPTNHHDLLTRNNTSHLYYETTNIPAELSAAFSYSPAPNDQSMAQTDQFYVSSNDFWKTTLPPQTLQKGIDFVLALEKPCLAHIIDHPESASGHALTVHAALMNYTFVPDKSGSACCQVPTVMVERLLQLSYSLPLWGEITPVQAWQRLSNRPGFDRYDAQRLQEFQAAISLDVRCYGFGAVIDEKDFERLSSHFFPQLY